MFSTTMIFVIYLALLALYVVHFKPCLYVIHLTALYETRSEVKVIKHERKLQEKHLNISFLLSSALTKQQCRCVAVQK